MLKKFNKYLEQNKIAWEKKVEIDAHSKFYNVNNFKKGKLSLNQIELDELTDVKNKSLLHLQCYFGLDTLSFARLGAIATGVDFCENAIAYAKQLNAEQNLNTNFICSDVYDLQSKLESKFDIIFCSYGSICWLPDLKVFAKIIKHFLKKNGIFYIVDFHPLLFALDYMKSNKIEHSYFFDSTPMRIIRKGTYAEPSANIKTVEYNWNHSISEIIETLINNDMKLQHIHEFSYMPDNGFPRMINYKKHFVRAEGKENQIPILFSLMVKNS